MKEKQTLVSIIQTFIGSFIGFLFLVLSAKVFIGVAEYIVTNGISRNLLLYGVLFGIITTILSLE